MPRIALGAPAPEGIIERGSEPLLVMASRLGSGEEAQKLAAKKIIGAPGIRDDQNGRHDGSPWCPLVPGTANPTASTVKLISPAHSVRRRGPAVAPQAPLPIWRPRPEVKTSA